MHMNDARKPRKCQVALLDERRLDFLIQPRLMSCDLLDMVASHFNLHEKEYFGLAFTEESGAQNWLRLDRRVLDHDLPRQEPLIFTFGVRFFVPNILILKEPITVELFFLQARILIFKGSIHCDSETVFELAGYALQAVYGDFTSTETAKRDLKKIAILPTRTLKEHPSISYCEDKVISNYKQSVGQIRGEAIVRYLCLFQSLPTYGVHYYEVKDKSSIPWWLGLSPKGIGVYDHNDKIKPRKLFQWNQIENIYFRDRKFSIEIRDSYKYEFVQSRNRTNSIGRKQASPSSMMVHAWYASTILLTKAMWSMAISQHQFYLDKKKVENKAAATRTLRDVAKDLSMSTASVQSSGTSDISDSISSDYSQSISTIDAESAAATRAAEREMASALLARKEALLEKLRQKTEELRHVCIQESEFIGEYPPETPFIVGQTLPPIRRRVGTSFEFSDLVVDGDKTDGAQEVQKAQRDVEIHSQITSAARKLAEDSNASKNVRKTRKINYQKSLRKLREVEDKLTKLKREYVAKSDEDDEDTDIDRPDYGSFNGEPYHPHHFNRSNYPRPHRTVTNITLRKPSSTSDVRYVGDVSERGTHSGPSSPGLAGSPRYKCPPSPSSRSYQGYFDSHYQYSPTLNGPRIEGRSTRGPFDNSRSGPAFQYSDSDTRSDSSTKPSSVSSFANSEDLADAVNETVRVQNGERSPPFRGMMISSWDNLTTNYSRSPSPRLSPGTLAAQSSESVSSEGDSRLPPYSPAGRMDRAFSFGSAMLRPPQSYSKKGMKYLNTSDLAIVSSTGNAGTYSLNHKGNPNSRSGPSLNSKVYSSTSSLSTLGSQGQRETGGMRSASSQVNMSMPYLIQSTLERSNQLSMPSFFEEDLEWNGEEHQEATLV